MKNFVVVFYLILVFHGLTAAISQAKAEETEMKVGQIAPDFSLPDQNGEPRVLADYRQRWVVLYFYPKDNTPGCTKEACQFRDDFLAIRSLGAEILGVSVDSQESHAKFAGKYNLPFPLLSDADGHVAKQYGALWSLAFIRFARRHTVIVDPHGKIAKIYREVEPETHSREVIGDLKALQRSRN
jgi:peroxiredoxin Q/BCP